MATFNGVATRAYNNYKDRPMEEKEVLVAGDASEAEVEKMVQATNPTENRLTPAVIDACIVAVDYYQFPGTSHTVCCIHLKNSFTVIGESSPVDPSNFNVEIGRKVAYEDARKKIWMLEGYRLKSVTYGERSSLDTIKAAHALKSEPGVY